ncbi:MAG: amidohydrolase [Thermoplasmatota archaeon]
MNWTPNPTDRRALVNGRIHTMASPDDTVDAIAWDGDTITATGDADVRAWAAQHDVALEDLEGRTVVPGFVDAHTHFLHVGVKHTRPDLRGATSRAEALDRVAAFLDDHPEGAVIAEGWDEDGWPDGAPTKADADRLAPDRPLVLRRICGHKAIANEAALPLIRNIWDDDTLVNMETGVLLEQPSLYLNEALPVPPEQLDAALQESCAIAHRLGVTTVGDYEQAPYREALLRAARRGTLTVRVACSIYVQQLESAISEGFQTGRRGHGPDDGDGPGTSPWVQDAGLKVFLDGSLGGHTAYLRKPYCDHAGHGMPNWTPQEVHEFFQKAHRHGIQIHAHAIGDAAIDQGLDGFEALERPTDEPTDGQTMNGRAVTGEPLRHRFEHYEIVHDDQVVRTAQLGIVASSQPNFVGVWSSKGGMYEERLGERFLLNNRFRSFKNAGLRLAFGSDGMPFGAPYGLQAAVDHPVEAERLTPAEAVWHYTAEAAWSLHLHDVGQLRPGWKADLLILDQPNLDAPPKTWTIQETISGGVSRGGNTEPILREA